MIDDVLVIHNFVEKEIPSNKTVWHESNAGVLDEVNAVTGALEKLGIDYKVESISEISQLPDVLRLNNQKIVFNLIEELPHCIREACYVPAICCAYGRSSTGNDTTALLLAQNKWQAKAILNARGVPCPQGTVVPIGKKICFGDLKPGKYVVKPVFSDASEGIDAGSIVELPSEKLSRAVVRIHEIFKQPAIVEQFIPQRELNVSVLQINDQVKILPIAEIDFSAFDMNIPRIVDYSAKWQVDSFAYNNTPRIIPAPLSERTADQVRQYAFAAWNALGCQDYARVDFRMDENEQAFALEVNPNPDISPEAGFAAALAAGGIKYEQFVKIIINNASLRQG